MVEEQTFALTQIGLSKKPPTPQNARQLLGRVQQKEKVQETLKLPPPTKPQQTINSSSLQQPRPNTVGRPNTTIQSQRREIPKRQSKTSQGERKRSSSSGPMQELINKMRSEVQTEFQQLYTQRNPKQVLESIRRIESARHIQPSIQELNNNLIDQKQIYNKYHHEYQLKMEKLKLLQNTAEALTQKSTSSQFLQDLQDQLDNKVDQMDDLLEIELFQAQQIENMIHNKKQNQLKFNKVQQKMKYEIQQQKYKYYSKEIEHQKSFQKLKKFNQEIIDQSELIESNRKIYQQKYEQNWQILKDKLKFNQIFQLEQEKDQDQRKKNLKFIQQQYDHELKLKEQDEEVLEKELKKNEEYIIRQEKLFYRIQEVTNVRNIQEMLPHLNYLKETEKNLQIQSEVLQKQIMEQKAEIQKLYTNFSQMNFNVTDKDMLVELKKSVDIASMEQILTQRNRILEDKESLVEKIEEMLAAATSCISRLLYQLQEGQESLQIKAVNICDHLSEVGLRLERMLFAINRNAQVLRNESINTDFVHTRPPAYMNLNENQFKQEKGDTIEDSGENLLSIDLHGDEEFQQLIKQKEEIKEQNKANRIITEVSSPKRK